MLKEGNHIPPYAEMQSDDKNIINLFRIPLDSKAAKRPKCLRGGDMDNRI